MQAEHWQKCTDIFDEAIERPAHERTAFIEQRCQGDEVLRRKVELLLKSHQEAGGFIESPAFEVAPELLLDDADALIGQHLGRYRIESVLGAGGMGVVYLAQDERLERKVGLKLLPQSLVADEAQLGRLKHEARTASALNHPNIVTIHEIGEVDGTHYIATEFIEGITLRERMAHGPILPNEALDIALQTASALSVAHAAGVVHRDIKPENIMLRPDGYVKVLDFGIAKFARHEMLILSASQDQTFTTQHGIISGTARYMSPEQARGDSVDSRSDIWSLGVVVYEMLAGGPPFQGDTPNDVIAAVLKDEPAPLAQITPEIPRQLERMVQRMVAKDRQARYSNAADLRAELRKLQREAKPFKSLAVLPLESSTADPAQEYFADGMTDALITNLAKIGALRVISRASVMHYKNAHRPFSEIARELNVDTVLTGSLARTDDRVRISVQLTDAATEQTLWAESYDRHLGDVLRLQRDVARDIADEIQIKLTPQEQLRFGKERPVNAQGYDHYLRGRFYLQRQTKDGNEHAIAALEQAVAADPTFAAAHAELAQAYLWKLFLFAPNEPQWAEKAFIEAEKALELDPDLAVAYLARGRTLWTPANHFPHEAAIRDYRHALELNPALDEARNQLALVYSHVGALAESIHESQKAIATNPNNYLARYKIGEALNFQCNNEDALTTLRAIPKDASPALVGHQIVWALYNLGRKQEAATTADRYLTEYPEDHGGLFVSLQAILAAADGDNELAEKRILLATERGKGFGHFHHTAYHIGCAYALMNKPEQAIKSLAFAAEDGFPCYPLFEKDPNLDSLRRDPRFIALLKTLEQQWEHYRSLL